MENLFDLFADPASRRWRPELVSFPMASDLSEIDYWPLARAIMIEGIAQYQVARKSWEESEARYQGAARLLREGIGTEQTPDEEALAGRWEAWSNLAYRRLACAERGLVRAIQVWFGYSKSAHDMDRPDYRWQTAGIAHEGHLYIASANRDGTDVSLTVVALDRLADSSAGGTD